MARYAMVIDTLKCVGCMDCVAVCKTENEVPLGFDRDWIVYESKGKFPNVNMEIRSERCNHCDNPPCVACCPCGASQKTDFGGIVLVDYSKCSGCKACIAACPYDARFVHPTEKVAMKCTFCIHRIKEGKDPACVSVCPTHCMYFGDLDDPTSEINKLLSSRKHKSLLPEAGTQPHIYYLT